MKEILYIEIPTPDTIAVKSWLQEDFIPDAGVKITTPEGLRLVFPALIPVGPSSTTSPGSTISETTAELSIFIWSVQRTTYLKVFRWAETPITAETRICQQLLTGLRNRFPNQYPAPPQIDLSRQTIFAALGDRYPQTVKFFQRMPNGEADLQRVYWWEQRWREAVRQPQQPKQVIFPTSTAQISTPEYDLIYIGGALGVIHAAVMARLGYRVLLVERLPFGRMHREWNISRDEFQSLIDLGLFTPSEFESLIAREYIDGFHKFFDANNPPMAKAAVLHTPTVLNVALDAEKLLRLCGDKLRAAGGTIWDETEFSQADISPTEVTVQAQHLPTQTDRSAQGRLLVDAMGTASPIAWQLNRGRAFDSVCPTVGGVVEGFDPAVWDARYGDVLHSHGDISRGRQLIWELFPGRGQELTIYLFHYHQVHPDNPGSLLEMYEDFFTILPEYRRCDPEQLVWKKPTFGYIPGYFSVNGGDRQTAFDRLVSIGDAASLQSPLVFTGFGSLVRNLARLTDLLDTALKHNLLQARHLKGINAYQSNIAVTWLFSKGMMVPTHRSLSPERVNAMLNTFFDILANEPAADAEAFIKDRVKWLAFNQMALKAAVKNPRMLLWIWELAGPRELFRWLGNYLNFTWFAWISSLAEVWFPTWLHRHHTWLESNYPALWLWLKTRLYALTYGMGVPQPGVGFGTATTTDPKGFNPKLENQP